MYYTLAIYKKLTGQAKQSRKIPACLAVYFLKQERKKILTRPDYCLQAKISTFAGV